MLKEDFKNCKTYLWGTGLEGQAVIKWWNENLAPQELFVIENDTVPDDAEIIIKSPGVSTYLPPVIEAKEKGVKFTSLMNIFFANLKKQTKVPKILAITGTKGKSTTSSLLAFMLEKLGKKVAIGGNIGASPLEFLGDDLDYMVLELSSFQLTDLEHSIDYGIIVNISHAHLDWHLNLENYVNDKLNIIKLAKNIIVNGDDKNLKNITGAVKYGSEGFCVKDGCVYDGDIKLTIPELQIKGDHNLSNLCADLTLLKMLGLNYNQVLPMLSEFEALPHRLQQVYQKNGYTFIDDSIATVAESVIAAVNAFDEDIAVIIGGFDNKPDYSGLDKFLDENEKVKIVVCLPDTGRLLTSSKCVHVENMKQAVEKSIAGIVKGVVLLSPAAPSFNLYKNYKERGNDFAQIAKETV